jgi:hypothetical protein
MNPPSGHTFLGSCAVAAALALLVAAPALRGQDVVISEFLAAGGDLADEDGQSSDWIEIENRGASVVNLDGWFLTDDPANLTRWRFPGVPLAAGERVIVFASGKDRAVAGRELHASFSLSADGELLALVLPDGRTIAHGYVPAYPVQHEDVSYGLPGASEVTELVAAGAAARFLVPAGDTGPGWQLPAHPDASWAEGPTGLGFGGDVPAPGPDEAVNVAPLGTATQSSDYGAGEYPASLAIDGSQSNFTHTAAGVNLPATWELDLGRPYALTSVVLHNRTGCCGSRLRDITVTLLDAPGGQVVYASELLNAENVLGGGGTAGPPFLEVDLIERTGGAVVARLVRVSRAPDPDLSGSGGQGNADEADVLSLAEVEVLAVEAGYAALIGTDVETAMRGANASLLARLRFTVEDPSRLESLRLLVKYEDGFAAWLNGRELARRNAPADLGWSSSATAERPGAQAVVFEEIDVTAHLDALAAGTNVLAVQGLNLSASDADFLILPVLQAAGSSGGEPRYFREPTPGAPNDSRGFAGFVLDTRFSHDRGFHDTPFAVEIATETPGAEIRYTLDGTVPDQAAGILYTGPVSIDRTTTLRARAFREGLEPTNVDTHTYIFLDDVILQDAQAALDAGFPSSWGGTPPDYGMDPDVVGA